MPYDVICIGAGPTGLACAIEAKRAGLRPLVIDKGCLCNSLFHYPTNMVFFTTPERMEIGDLPMTTLGGKPTRLEALKYYRRAVEHYEIETRLYERVDRIDGHDGDFVVRTITSLVTNSSREAANLSSEGSGVEAGDFSPPNERSSVDLGASAPASSRNAGVSARHSEYHARKIIIATGYYDLPNPLGVPGEDLPHVSHYFTDPHPYWNQRVVVIGAKNSAAEAALDLFRAGARVTLVHRGAEVGRTLKYWVRPDIENRIRAGEVKALFNHRVTRFEPGLVYLDQVDGRSGDTRVEAQDFSPAEKRQHNEGALALGRASSLGEVVLPAEQVFVMTGYHPDFNFLIQQGIKLAPGTMRPDCDPETLETNVPGIHLAGVVVGGRNTSEIFIENGRFHGKEIIAAITGKGRITEPPPVSPPGE